MIEEYFKLIRAPFKLSADPFFYFDSATHHKAMSYLLYGIQQAEGFVVITGDTGVGKTTLVDQLLASINKAQILAVKMNISHLAPGAVLDSVLSAFHLDAGEGTVAGTAALEEFLGSQYEAGKQVVLVIDEAQNLSAETLEELRVLTNINREGMPLLQVFLVGQSEMKSLIARDGMEQLRQRVIASYHVSPLSREETAAYIDHRLYAAGYREEQSLFTDKAQDLIYTHTNGIPRRINMLCARVLLQTALDQKDYVDAASVQSVIDDFEEELRESLEDVPAVPLDDDAEMVSDIVADSLDEADMMQLRDPALAVGKPVEDVPDTVEDLTDVTQDPKIDQPLPFVEEASPAGQPEADHASGEGMPDDVASPLIDEEDAASTRNYQYQAQAAIVEQAHAAIDEQEEADSTEQTEAQMRTGRQRSQETDMVSVLDRIGLRGKRGETSPQKPAGDDDTFEEVARQLRAATGGPELDIETGTNAATSDRVAALKADLDGFVNEVRDGLHDVEASMKTVSERIAKIESYREARSRLLSERLLEIETLLKELQGRK